MSDQPQRLRAGAYALCFAASLPILQAKAREMGYALTVHGSMATDFDMVAVPWIEEAREARDLAELICGTVDGRIYDIEDRNPAVRPHGRLAWSIYFNKQIRTGPYIDLSIMPKRPVAPTPAEALIRLEAYAADVRIQVEKLAGDYKSLDLSHGIISRALDEYEKGSKP